MLYIYQQHIFKISGPWPGNCEEESWPDTSWDFFEEASTISTEGVIDIHYNVHKNHSIIEISFID